MNNPLVVVFIVVLIVILLFLIFNFSRKNMMNNLLKQQKDLFSKNQNVLEDLASTVVKSKKNILDKNGEDLEYIAKKEAEIKKDSVRITAKAIKEGLTESAVIYCKHCGASIDTDSKFCKKCGKKQ